MVISCSLSSKFHWKQGKEGENTVVWEDLWVKVLPVLYVFDDKRKVPTREAYVHEK